MNKKIIFGIIAIIVIVILVWVSQNSQSGPKEIVKIGVVAPVTGGAAAYGSTLAKGVEMALADLSKKDTIYTYEVVVEDDASNPATSANAASKLINIDKVKAIITTTSSSGNAVKSLAEKSGVIHVCDCTDVSIGNAQYNFTNLILPVDEVKAWIEYANKQKIKTVGILVQIHPGTMALVNEFLPQAKNAGIEIVFNESFEGGTRDFKTIIAKAKSKNPDMYLVMAFPPSLDIVSKELFTAGIKNISTTGLFTTSPTPEIYDGLWFTDSTLTDLNFRDRFASLYPNIRFNARTAPYGYDIFNMIVDSIEKGGDAYLNLKALTKYEGKVGLVTKEPDSNNFRSSPSIWIMRSNGIPEMI